LLDFLSKAADPSAVGQEAKRAKEAQEAETTTPLGAFLADLRAAKRFTLRDVEEGTKKAVSNAYLSQLEKGHISKPHPNILHTLAQFYGVAYETMMEKAGYIAPGGSNRVAAFAIDDLTKGEEDELLKYLAFLRTRGSTT
jgi:transcriptional regulator with XRE-family HTH domain